MLYSNYAKQFNKLIFSGSKHLKTYNNIFNRPRIFDVSLRDGLQGLNVSEYLLYNLENKQDIYNDIIFEQQPEYLEIGSYVSYKIMPIMRDTLKLYDYSQWQQNKYKPEIYILIPTLKKLKELDFLYKTIFDDCNNYSFITSVSNSFQMKNINKSLMDTKNDIKSMLDYLDKKKDNYNIKLYISCINECPIEGKIDNDYIVDEIMYYYMNFKIRNLCLSDTLGTLDVTHFDYIINRCIFWGLLPEYLSLHLHYDSESKEDEIRIKNIIESALMKKINLFDLSIIKSGGCSITVPKEKLKSNMSYELFYKILYDLTVKHTK